MKPTKIGFPVPFGGMTNIMQNPKFSTVLGLLLDASNDADESGEDHEIVKHQDLILKLSESLKNVFREIF